jgi:hypothetical protein
MCWRCGALAYGAIAAKEHNAGHGRAFVLVGCAVLAVHGFPVVGPLLTAGLAGFALLYLVVGIHGAQGSRIDPMSVFWWGVLALGCGALLVFIEGIRL